jgi:hypothetical protein
VEQEGGPAEEVEQEGGLAEELARRRIRGHADENREKSKRGCYKIRHLKTASRSCRSHPRQNARHGVTFCGELAGRHGHLSGDFGIKVMACSGQETTQRPQARQSSARTAYAVWRRCETTRSLASNRSSA